MNFNLLWAGAVADELVRAGARDAVICPGSRSAPLALALADRLRPHTVIDDPAVLAQVLAAGGQLRGVLGGSRAGERVGFDPATFDTAEDLRRRSEEDATRSAH